MTDIQISSPRESDWEWIKEKHAEAAWLSLPPGIQSAVTLQTVRANLTGQTAELLQEHGKSNQVFTARLTDCEQLAGYIWVGEIKSGFTGTAQAYIFNIHVAEEFRERGIGTRLLACAEDWAHTHQYQRIGLAVSASNAAALHLYEKTGYVVETMRMFKETGGEG